MENYTLTESYRLPSDGKLYGDKVNPEITLRSMTTVEEMKRLSHTDTPYKTIADVIDACIVSGGGISSYDMCIGDYQFLLHKLRVVTYGRKYNMNIICPYCGNIEPKETDLDELKVMKCPEDIETYFNIALPVTQKSIHLRMQTPRILDIIEKKNKDAATKAKGADQSLLILLRNIIDTVDGVKPDEVMLDQFIRTLPMKDTNYIVKSTEKLNNLIGIDTSIKNVCSRCGVPYFTTFPFTSEFFGPSID